MEEFRKNIRKILIEELETFDSSLFNFLMRRVKIEEIDLGTDWFDQKQLKMIGFQRRRSSESNLVFCHQTKSEEIRLWK